MSDKMSTEFIPNGWKSLLMEVMQRPEIEIDFGNLKVEISFDSLLKDLIIPPKPDHILTLWNIYNPGKNIPSEIDKMLRSEDAPSWSQITKTLKTPCNRLYQVASQNAYRLPYTCNYENQKILRDYSNILVECLIHRLNNPIQIDLEIQSLCVHQGISFNIYKMLSIFLEYHRLILPYPYRLRENREVFAEYTKYSTPKEKKQDFCDEVLSRDNRVKERFASYQYLKASMDGWIQQLDEKSRRDFFSILDRSNIENGTDYERVHAVRVSSPRNSFISLSPMMEKAGNLFQCPFCYRFSSKGLPPRSNQFPPCCDQEDCKKAYEKWSKHVQRAGFSTNNKAQDGCV